MLDLARQHSMIKCLCITITFHWESTCFHRRSLSFCDRSLTIWLENECCCPQLTFQMLTLLHKYLHHQSRYSTTWDSKYLFLIDQIVRAFAMNPKLGGSSPPEVETFFCINISDTFTRTSPLVGRKWILLLLLLKFQMLTLLYIYIYTGTDTSTD